MTKPLGLFIGTQTLRCCHPTTRGKFKALSMIDKILSQFHVSFIKTTFLNIRRTNWATQRVRNEACIKKKKKFSLIFVVEWDIIGYLVEHDII